MKTQSTPILLAVCLSLVACQSNDDVSVSRPDLTVQKKSFKVQAEETNICTQEIVDAINAYNLPFELKRSTDLKPVLDACATISTLKDSKCLAEKLKFANDVSGEFVVVPGEDIEISYAAIRGNCSVQEAQFAELVAKEEQLAEKGKLPLNSFKGTISLKVKDAWSFKQMLDQTYYYGISSGSLITQDQAYARYTTGVAPEYCTIFAMSPAVQELKEGDVVTFDVVTVSPNDRRSEESRVDLTGDFLGVTCHRKINMTLRYPPWTLNHVRAIFSSAAELF